MNTNGPAPIPGVMIVEDDDTLRDDFARAVGAAPGLRLWGNAGSLREARALLDAGPPPDVLLVDLGLPDGDGTTLIRAMREQTPDARALVISVFGDEARVVRALAAGAQGYLLKDATADELVRALHEVIDGAAPLSPRIARYLLHQFRTARSPAEPGRTPLSSREAQILTLVSHGHKAHEAAERLGLSVHTINTHLRNCYTKLEVTNRVQAVNRARTSGQIS